MKNTVTSSMPIMLCSFDRKQLWEMFRDQAARAYDLTWIAAVEEHFLGETFTVLGQRTALARMAWAFMRIWRRLSAVGLQRDGSVPLPFRQQDMADALGLSLVHANKTVARLKEARLAVWQRGLLTVIDLKALALAAGIQTKRPKSGLFSDQFKANRRNLRRSQVPAFLLCIRDGS